MTVILASTSAVRRQILANAGVEFEVVSPGVDEDALKTRHTWEPAEMASALADAKALAVSSRMKDAVVIGADQVLNLDGTAYGKPCDVDDARAQLRALRGRRHRLETAVCCAADGFVVWRHHAAPELSMRQFSDGFREHYLRRAGRAACASVGAYQVESWGAQLFDAIEGDYFSVLGLPLLPLLAFLRERGAIPA